ncbi:MAG TPA: hypothetical protein VFH22_02735 [Rhodocyclaceae bacterium]|nr:hypothetical protein [Rhodocyclaceae bacterium]
MKRTGTPTSRVAAAAGGADERRHYHQAREAFEYAYSMLAPFLSPEAGWQGRSLYHVSFNVVSDNFPQLGHEEIQALLEAVQRVFVERTGLPGNAAA